MRGTRERDTDMLHRLIRFSQRGDAHTVHESPQLKKHTNSRHTTNGNKKMRLHFTIYTPYRTCSFSCMTGGNEDTCAAHPAASCCLKPFSSCWNMWFSSCEGLFHLTIALQNHSKLCGYSVSFNPLRCTAATYLGDASRVGLHQCAQTTER